MYVCGPTVYAGAHIGHARSAIVFDVIRRYLEHSGYKVIHVMNFTDVDDKIIVRANEIGVNPMDFANHYVEAFLAQLRQLNILAATAYPRATQEIPHVLQLISGLIDKGYAYVRGGEVLYRVTRFEGYGKLSGRKLEEQKTSKRVQRDIQKEHPWDFTLWKPAKDGEPSWLSPWGLGRPGWHIECSAMCLHHLGEQIDIHGGGNDLIFPHHENEIAQSEAFSGSRFARYWVHNGMLQLGDMKMSKSLGNVISIEDFLNRHTANALRMLVLSTGYRSPLTFTEGLAEESEHKVRRMYSALVPGWGEINAGDACDSLRSTVNAAVDGFMACMDDDFNTPGAIGHLFNLVRAINQARDIGIADSVLQPAQETLNQLTGVLGFEMSDMARRDADEPLALTEGLIQLVIESRNALRAAKQWSTADQLRRRLQDLGIELEDTPSGTRWRYRT